MTTVYLLLRIILAIAISAYLAACIYLYFTQARVLFPGAFMPFPAELEGLGTSIGLEAVTITASDGEKLFAFRHTPADGKPIVILFHGNASYPEAYDFLYSDWIAEGYGIVAPAARGYPRSTGLPEGEKMLADALDIYDWAAKAYPGHPVFVVGQSLGSAPAVHLAAHRPVAGVVLISAFKSMQSLAASKLPYMPTTLLLKSPFRSDLDIPKVTAPILFLHGEMDALVPIASARELAALAKASVQFEVIHGAGHAAGLLTPTLIDAINRFLGISKF